jgi:hypothetical protein
VFAPKFGRTVMIAWVGVTNVLRDWFLHAGNKADVVLEKTEVIGRHWAQG